MTFFLNSIGVRWPRLECNPGERQNEPRITDHKREHSSRRANYTTLSCRPLSIERTKLETAMPTAQSHRPNQRATLKTFAAIVIASTSALACGSGATGSPSDPGTGGTVQFPGGAGKTFVPEGIVYE